MLEIIGLCKKYGKKQILNNISLSIKENEIAGLIGPNGSGKTTMLNCISTLTKKDSGVITLHNINQDKNHEDFLGKLNYLFDTPSFYEQYTGLDNLKFFQSIKEADSQTNINDLIELVGLESKKNEKIRTYSLGMKRRLEIARSIIGNPKLILMDEPFNGLDINGIKELSSLIKKINESGVSFLISSHQISELSSFCNTIYIINNGEIVRDLEQNKNLLDISITHNIESNVSFFAEIKYIQILRQTKTKILIRLKKSRLGDLFSDIADTDINFEDVEVMQPQINTYRKEIEGDSSIWED